MASRITVVENLYYQRDGFQPVQVESMFWRPIATEEEMLSRQVEIGSEWQPLETWWIKQAAMVCICNREGTMWAVNPYPREIEEAKARVIEVGLQHAELVIKFAEIPYKESLRFNPSDVKSVRVRCRTDRASAVVSVVPNG